MYIYVEYLPTYLDTVHPQSEMFSPPPGPPVTLKLRKKEKNPPPCTATHLDIGSLVKDMIHERGDGGYVGNVSAGGEKKKKN